MTRASAPLPSDLLARLLQPYRADCRYIHDAVCARPQQRCSPHTDDPATWIEIASNCSIPASCYIDDTGHFNAVELNITYNQMLYAGLAAVADGDLLPELAWDRAAFFRHQLPDVLIVDYHARFPQPLDPRRFTGRFWIHEVLPKPHKRMLLLRTGCAVRSADGGAADADVLIALVRLDADGRRGR